jgi:hypothetical protein
MLNELSPGQRGSLKPADLLGFPVYFWLEWDSERQAHFVKVWPKPMDYVEPVELKPFDTAVPLPKIQRGAA